MDNKEILEMADKLKALEEEKKEKEQYLKDLNQNIDELNEKLSNAMTDAELDKFTHSGSTFYLKSRLFASAIAGKKDDLIKALKESGNGTLVVEQVNANTLSSFIKEQRDTTGCEDVPDYLKDIVKTYEKVSVGIRKA